VSEKPRLSSLDLWAAHERQCLLLLRRALTALAADCVSEAEDDLNRELYWHLVRANHEAARDGEPPLPPVTYEGRNPPSASDEERARREFKIPDFAWGLTDHLATDPRRSAKHFVIECKRLTRPVRRDWIYTKQYIVAGVLRFVREEHAYGKDMRSGAMVGYLQDILAADAIHAVNATAAREAIAALLVRQSNEDEVDLEHDLDRPFPESPFRLQHLWARVAPAPQR
jgi:hypothetical protein